MWIEFLAIENFSNLKNYYFSNFVLAKISA